MNFDTTLVNNILYPAANIAGVNAVNNLGGGNYSVDASQYAGAFTDFWGPVPANNILSATTMSFNATQAPGIITFQYTYGDGSVVSGFGGDVIGWNSRDILVQLIDGFVPINQAAGTYVGSLDPSDYLIFGGSGQDLSFASNGGNGANLPLLFGDTGSFAVPEPSTYALVLVALIAIIMVRRFWRGRAV